MTASFIIKTLGCKVNQYESDGIAGELIKHGFVLNMKKSGADICIVNTCAVTSKAAMQSRQVIRKLIRDNPEARIIVTGCHAQTDPADLSKINGIDYLIGHVDKFAIAQHIIKNNFSLSEHRDTSDFDRLSVCQANRFNTFEPAVTGQMTRAYLKIQDGCHAFCSYCIVPYARGKSRSMPQDEVFNHLKALHQKGVKEVILTGIHTGLYGLDLPHPSSLTELLEAIIRKKPIHRVRLSSVEPMEMTPHIIDLIKSHDILCDHFHIPLQSGDPSVLKDMGRPYDSEFFKELVLKIHQTIPDACIGIDVMVGFPTEGKEEFENTYALIKALPISYLHVFPYSPRKGTPAFNMKKRSSDAVIQERCEHLRNLGENKRLIFYQSQLGSVRPGLIQHKRDNKTNQLIAITDNYMPVLVDGEDQLKNTIINVSGKSVDSSNRIFGKICY